jgi:hypothetical protein
MKHPLPQALGRARLACAFAIALSSVFTVSAAAQNASYHGNRHEGRAVLHIQLRIVPYAMTPPRHHKDDVNHAAGVNILSKQAAMTVIEQTRNFNPTETTVRLGPEGAVLKTLTVVLE